MININGKIFKDSEAHLSVQNRGLAYGDAIFETIKVNNKPLFWESHYFRLMASMRILRMRIPMNFTPEFLENQIMDLLASIPEQAVSYRVKITVYRASGGLYTPNSNNVEFSITAEALDSDLYIYKTNDFEIELFKDYLIAPNLLSTLKTNNKVVNVLAGIFAKENNYQNCLLLNTNKNIIEALNGNVFLVKDNVIKTPPVSDGALKGIMRGQLIDIIKKSNNFELDVSSIFPFELQKVDEIFITNAIQGIVSVTKFRKKFYANEISKMLLKSLNLRLRIV